MAQADSIVERYVFNGITYGEVIRAGARVSHSTFVSAPDSSMQMGLLAHGAGFVEAPLVVQRGRVAIDFFDAGGALLKTVELLPGDAMLLMSGGHSLRVIEDAQCVSVKQGPFLGVENDKIPLPGR
jgi:hypothetical protein